MNILPLLIASVAVLFLILIVAIVLAVWDWKKWLKRKIGNNYAHGYAHIKLGSEWVYRESELFYEGDDAMTYTRKLDRPGPDGKTTASDILPNSIGFAYGEETGRRVYRVQPGGTIATADDNDKPVTDYPSELISVHTIDRAVAKYIQTVSGNKKSNAGMYAVIIILIIALVAGAIFLYPKSRPPAPAPAQTTANTTQAAPAPPPPGGFQTGPSGGGQ